MLLFCLFACFTRPDPAFDSAGDTAADTAADSAADTDCGSDADCDGYLVDDDCDDQDALIHPGAAESCDGLDNDCDGEADEDAGGTYYTDADGDGYGDPAGVMQACERPEQAADNGADCNDADATIHPDAEELANGADDDCDGEADEGLPTGATLTSVSVAWDSSGASITVEGSAAGWSLGIAETRAKDSGWYGESCILGSQPLGYDDYGWDVCHSLEATGGRLTGVYTPDDVEDGRTLFNDVLDAAGNMTYMLTADDDSACWVWGDAPRYYVAFGCTSV